MHDIGTALLYLSFIATLGTAVLAFAGARTRSNALLEASHHGMAATWLLFAAQAAALLYGLVTHDFSNKYIAAYTDMGMPLPYLVAGFWGGEKGALLFWSLAISSMAMVAVGRNRTQSRAYLGYANGVLHASILFFAVLMVFESNPFEVYHSHGGPADGRGMNPQLQNPIMAFHPPSLLTGYIAFTVPFAFGVAALITGELGNQWLKDIRRWTLVSWLFLSIGLVLGGAWAYQELGWGGFWMWDPVENAGLIPWFTSTAFLHSVMIQERRHMLKRWNAVLVCLTFLLTIFGTFLTRSQLIDSVHAFADSTLAEYFLVYMAIITVVSAALIAWRWGELRADNQLDSVMSREAIFILNNVLLVGCAFVVMWGTVFSKVSEAEGFRALYNRIADAVSSVGMPMTPMVQAVELGEPWFNRVMTPLGLILLLLTGVGPLISWRRATWKNFERNFKRPLVVSSLVTVGLVTAWSLRTILRQAQVQAISFGAAYADWADHLTQTDLYAVICIYFAVFVIWTIALEFHVGAQARRRTRGEGYGTALLMLTLRNKRRYGGYIVHIGVVFCFLAFTGMAFRLYEPEVSLSPGDTHRVGDYNLVYTGSTLRWIEDGAFVATRSQLIATDRHDALDGGVVERVRQAALKVAPDADVRAEAEPGTARVLLTFADEHAARLVGEHAFVRSLAGRVKRLPDDAEQPNALRLMVSDELMDVLRVTPMAVMGLIKEVRAHFEERAADPATVQTTPGQPVFAVVFEQPEAKARFAAALERGPDEGLLLARFDPRDRPEVDGKPGGRVVAVPAGAGVSMWPEVRFYAKHSSPTTEVAIDSKLDHDLYLAMRPQQGQPFITLLAMVFPLVSFLWAGAATMILGAFVCLLPTGARRPVVVPGAELAVAPPDADGGDAGPLGASA